MNNLNNNIFLNINMNLDRLDRQELRDLLARTLTRNQRRLFGVNGTSSNTRIREFLRNYRRPQITPYNQLRQQARQLGYNEANGRTQQQLQAFINQRRIQPIPQPRQLKPTIQQVNPFVRLAPVIQRIPQPRQLQPAIQQVNPFVRFQPVLRQITQLREVVPFRTGERFRSRVNNLLGMFNRERRFRLKIISSLNPNIFFTKEFYGYENMFLPWYLQLINADNREEASDGSLIDYDNIGQDAYKFVRVEVTPLGRLFGNCDDEYKAIKFENPKYILSCVSYESHNNTCGVVCINNKLGLDYTPEYYYKTYNIRKGSGITQKKLEDIYTAEARKIGHVKPLLIIDKNFRGRYDELTFDYILHDTELMHYYDVINIRLKDKKKQIRRGTLYWDIETRPDYTRYNIIKTVVDKKIVEVKTYRLMDTITHVWYRTSGKNEYSKISFETDYEGKSSVRKFLDWINVEMNNLKKPHHYYCYAHNGSRFDNYFLVANMTKVELMDTYLGYRGIALIKMDFNDTIFLDTCCFLTNSLKNLCKSFKVDQSKKTEFEYNGEIMTNEQLCFYKPELSVKEFMELKNTEPEFWELYNEYCLYDCISLQQIWDKFKDSYRDICNKISPPSKKERTNKKTEKKSFDVDGWVYRNCQLTSASTIGGLAKKMVNCINEQSSHYKKYILFYEEDSNYKIGDETKHQFIRKFARGGISHVNKHGIHKAPVVSYDITSEYPSAMNYMEIPIGVSRYVNYYASHFRGFYHLRNLVFKEGSKQFKPIAEKNIDTGILNWITGDTIQELYIDTYMIEFLKREFGLISFEVVKGLVSAQDISADKLFGKYVMGLFNGKAEQDVLKDIPDSEYNPALREAIKLFLNSVTGKLVERTEKYMNKVYTTNDVKKKYYDIGIEEEGEARENDWLICGVRVYSWSKELLFSYINCLPKGSDDVINVETDSIYFHKRNEKVFIENLEKMDHDIIKIGNNLGNIKKEKEVLSPSYFIRKKVYKCGDDYKDMKCKGIPSKTIDDYGNPIELFSEDMYKKLANGEEQTFTYKTLKKNLFGKTEITSHTSNKTITPLNKSIYKIYE